MPPRGALSVVRSPAGERHARRPPQPVDGRSRNVDRMFTSVVGARAACEGWSSIRDGRRRRAWRSRCPDRSKSATKPARRHGYVLRCRGTAGTTAPTGGHRSWSRARRAATGAGRPPALRPAGPVDDPHPPLGDRGTVRTPGNERLLLDRGPDVGVGSAGGLERRRGDVVNHLRQQVTDVQPCPPLVVGVTTHQARSWCR
jgi:hypothetical protein